MKKKTDRSKFWNSANDFLDDCSEEELAVFVTMVRARQNIYSDQWWRKSSIDDVKYWLDTQSNQDHIECRIVRKYYEEKTA